jgi:hypothetical protein
MATENIVLLAFAALLGTLHLVGGSLSGLVRPSAPRNQRGSSGRAAESPPPRPPPRQTLEITAPHRSEEDPSGLRDSTAQRAKRSSPDAAA